MRVVCSCWQDQKQQQWWERHRNPREAELQVSDLLNLIKKPQEFGWWSNLTLEIARTAGSHEHLSERDACSYDLCVWMGYAAVLWGQEEICFKSEAFHRYSASEICMLWKCYVIYMKYKKIHNFKVLLLQDKSWWSHHQNTARNLWPETGTTEVWKQSSQVLSLQCMCGGNVSAFWIRLLQRTLLSFLVTFFMYLFFFFYIFYCLLNSFFQLCFMWSSAKGKQLCPEEHSENITLTKRELVPL